MFRNGLEPWHLLVVLIAFIALFGSKKLPETARAVGKSLRILKSETNAMKADGGPPPPAAPSTPATGPEPTAAHPAAEGVDAGR
jgi:sec-independent protein translocase protein TatA